MEKIFENDLSLKEWTGGFRDEKLNQILSEEYGFRNKDADKANLSYKVIHKEKINGLAISEIAMTYLSLKMRFYIYRKDDNKIHPGFLFMLHEYAEDHAGPDLIKDYPCFSICPIDEIIRRGYFVAVMPTREIAQDKFTIHNDSYKGIFETINKVKKPEDWGTLQAWSWGLSKVMDYLEKQDFVDSNNVAIIGHSRGGKTALITGAQDERFKLVISSCSGQSGAALSRNRKQGGETIKLINQNFGYWFNENFKKYNDCPENLPFDQHHLLAMIAPRYLYVFSAQDDLNADPESELLCCKFASSYFELYNVKGLIIPDKIRINRSYNDGHIAYHLKNGGHCLEPRDWLMIMDYFDKILYNKIK